MTDGLSDRQNQENLKSQNQSFSGQTMPRETSIWGGCVSFLYTYQETKIFQYCTCPAGRVTFNFHSSFKHMHLSFKMVCNKEDKGVICNKTFSSNSSQSTCPVGPVLWEELLVLSRFHS